MGSDPIMRGGPGHGLTWPEFNKKFGDRIGQLQDQVFKQREEIARLSAEAQVGRDFKVLMKAINSNPITKKEWGRLMMSMRLVGMDQNPKENETNG